MFQFFAVTAIASGCHNCCQKERERKKAIFSFFDRISGDRNEAAAAAVVDSPHHFKCDKMTEGKRSKKGRCPRIPYTSKHASPTF